MSNWRANDEDNCDHTTLDVRIAQCTQREYRAFRNSMEKDSYEDCSLDLEPVDYFLYAECQDCGEVFRQGEIAEFKGLEPMEDLLAYLARGENAHFLCHMVTKLLSEANLIALRTVRDHVDAMATALEYKKAVEDGPT